MEQPKLTVKDVKRLMEVKPEPLPLPPPPQPAIEYPVKTEPEPQPESPGGGQFYHHFKLFHFGKSNVIWGCTMA